MRIVAHAKVNLALSVGPPGPDGLHPLCALFVCVDLADEVTLGHAAETSFDARWAPDAPRAIPLDWGPEDDLCVRALRLVEREVGRDLPTSIRLVKRIPVGGGLGGGSADAAAVLRGLVRLHGLSLSSPTLVGIGSALGSDVPFFLDEVGIAGGLGNGPPRAAIVSGVGERVERIEGLGGHLLLAFPDATCSTPEVYRAFDAMAQTGALGIDEQRVARAAALARRGDFGGLFNDLAAPACTLAPEVGRVQHALASALDRPVFVTGSGSTVFAHATDPVADVKRAREAMPGVPVRVVSLVGGPGSRA